MFAILDSDSVVLLCDGSGVSASYVSPGDPLEAFYTKRWVEFVQGVTSERRGGASEGSGYENLSYDDANDHEARPIFLPLSSLSPDLPEPSALALPT